MRRLPGVVLTIAVAGCATGPVRSDHVSAPPSSPCPAPWLSESSCPAEASAPSWASPAASPSAAVGPAPTFYPPPGRYAGPIRISLWSPTPRTLIRFTTDGSAPKTSSRVYTGPLTVSRDTTIHAIAEVLGSGQSAVSTGRYAIRGSGPAVGPLDAEGPEVAPP